MAIQRAGFLGSRRNFWPQPQTTPQMADNGGRHFFQLREVAQPLKRLQQDNERQQMHFGTRKLAGESDLFVCWRVQIIEIM